MGGTGLGIFVFGTYFLGTLGQGTAEVEGGFHNNGLGLVGRMIFFYLVGGLFVRPSQDWRFVSRRWRSSRGQARPDAVHLVHGGEDDVKDGGGQTNGQPGVDEEQAQGESH